MNVLNTELQKRIEAFIKANTPIESNGKVLSIENIRFTVPKELDDYNAQIQMKYSRDSDLKGFVRGVFIIRDKKTGKVLKQTRERDIVPFYYATERNTYVVNGVERVILNKMSRKPGVYTTLRGNGAESQMVFASHKDTSLEYVPSLKFAFSPSNMSFKVSAGKTNYDGVSFLKALGFSDTEIIKAMGNNEIADSVFRKNNANISIGTIYKQITGKAPVFTNEQDIRDSLFAFLTSNASFGEGDTIKATLGVQKKTLDKDGILRTVDKLFKVSRSAEKQDNVDDIRFKKILNPNDQVMEKLQQDWNAFSDKVKKDLESNNNNILGSLYNLASPKNSGITKLMKGEMSDTADQNSPLMVEGYKTQITQLADGLSDTEAKESQRNLKGMSMNRIDPVDTPESLKAGLVEHLTEGAQVKGGTILIPVLKVSQGSADVTDKNTVNIDPVKEYDCKVAYHNLDFIKKVGNKITLVSKTGTVPGRYKGQRVNLKIAEVQYIDKHPQSVFGEFANMIPFVTNDDGNRVTFGSKMQRQSMVLKNRELPLVSTVSSTGETYEEKLGQQYGKPILSQTAGTVVNIDKSKIYVQDSKGKVHEYQYYNYFPLNSGYINNEVVVKVGDKVKSGQMLAEGWQTRDGKLATGVNAKVAFMSYKGYNYEDGLVVSEGFANKMAVEDVQNIDFEVKKDWIGGKGSNVKQQFATETNLQEVFANLDKDGIIKEGTKVKDGSILMAYMQPMKEDETVFSLFQNPSKKKQKYKPGYYKIPAGSYVAGEVKRVLVLNGSGDSKQKIVVTIVQSKPLKVGDKLAGKHGNKGTISLVVPDNEMPTRADGEKLDVLYSCAAVPSRKNLGQIFETNAGLIAEKTGKPIVINNFDPTNTKKVRDGLKKIGIPDGKMKVVLHEVMDDGKIKNIQTDNPVVVGNMYMMKLIHKVDDKIQSRVGDEKGVSINRQTNMPGKSTGMKEGERHNPMSLDSMATDGLIGHQAVWNILESTTIKADGGGDVAQRAAMFNAIKTGKLDGLDQYSAVPETVNVLSKKLKALGLNVTPMNDGKAVSSFNKNFDSLRLSPMKPSEMMKMIGKNNEVTEKKLLDPKANGVNARAKNGLADERIFGELDDPLSKNKWGYINLVTPVANPVYAGLKTDREKNDIYSLLTGIKHDDIQKMSEGKLIMVADPDEYKGAAFDGLKKKEIEIERKRLKENMKSAGLSAGQLIDPAALEKLIAKHGEILWKTGGEGLLATLDKIDVGASLREAKKELKKSKKPEDVNLCYKKVKALEMLRQNKMEASDLMLKYVPVMPLYLRDPGIAQGETVFKVDANTHYGNIISHNNVMKKTISNGTDIFSYRTPLEASKETGRLYSLVANLSGHIDSVDSKTKMPMKGIANELAGKTGLIHEKMMKKRQDFSARSVIGVDPNLGMDEVGVPMDIAKNIFKLEIIRDLVKTGRAKDEAEAEQKWNKMDSDAISSVKKLAKSNPVIINRSPSLHKFSIQAFNPVIKENKPGLAVRNIQLNPLVVTGFNADFDGDQMSMYLPVTRKAKQEAKKLLMPSQNLVSETNGKLVPSIRHEMALGIYYLTMNFDSPTGSEPLKYTSMQGVRKDYKQGKLKPTRTITVNIPGTGNITTIVGCALVNSLIPTKYRDFKKAWRQSDINAMIKSMYDEMEVSNGKTISRRDIVECLEKLKDLGFEASTRSGISLGINDLGDEKAVESKYKLSKINSLEGKERLEAWSKVQDKMESDLKKGAFLKKNNPAQILLDSGARGSAGQFRRMMGTVGIGKDVEGNVVSPIAPSHLKGLSAEEYFVHGHDSRKGLYDRSVSTAKPGAVFKTISSAMQNVVIKEKDCGTSDGIMMKKWHTSLVGRVAAEDVFAKGGKTKICKKGSVITQRVRDEIVQKAEIDDIKVRSPLRCKTVNGVCAKCYGHLPGTAKFPTVGTPVGVLAAQAIGEPISQSSMNTFHTGGTTGTASSSLDQIKAVLGARTLKNMDAIIANNSGKITKITKGTPGTQDTVYIDGHPIKVPHYPNGQSKPLRVSEGDYVTKGDFITVGNIDDIYQNKSDFTMARPKDLYDKLSGEGQNKALNKTRDYMASSLDQTLTFALGGREVGKSNGIDRRHMELITKHQTSQGVVTDSLSPSYMKGQTVNINEVEQWNRTHTGLKNARNESISNASRIVGKLAAETKKKGNTILVQEGELITSSVWTKLQMAGVKKIRVTDEAIKYSPTIAPIDMNNNMKLTNENAWVGNLAAGREGNFKSEVARASMIGAVDPLSDNRSRRMTGKLLRIGEGFNTPKSVANNISNKLLNFFKKE